MRLDVGIFAYNEAKRIANVLADLAHQSVFLRSDIEIRIVVLANGCRDDTVAVANKFIQRLDLPLQSHFAVLDLPFKGKSRTWNHFVHSIAGRNADFLLFLDGDIRLPNADHISQMLKSFAVRPELRIFNSKPVKVVAGGGHKGSGMVAKLVTSMGGTFTNYKTTVCGQCYMVRANAVRSIYMPIGLPVEDGFLRAMLLTDCLTAPEDLTWIYGEENVWHTYESIAGLHELFSHQVRIIIGSAVNAAVFSALSAHREPEEALKAWGSDENALRSIIERQLPAFPYGYIPFSFLTKRVRRILSAGVSLKTCVYCAAGFLFDLIVYVVATIKMFRGAGVGHW